MQYNGGSRYEGYYKNDKREGEGVLFDNERAIKIYNS